MAESWFDPAGLIVAERDGEIVAFHWTKVHDSGADEGRGEVYVVGVSPAEQGSGLGRVVLDAGLAHLHGRGVPEVLLYVEADNEPGRGPLLAAWFHPRARGHRRHVRARPLSARTTRPLGPHDTPARTRHAALAPQPSAPTHADSRAGASRGGGQGQGAEVGCRARRRCPTVWSIDRRAEPSTPRRLAKPWISPAYLSAVTATPASRSFST